LSLCMYSAVFSESIFKKIGVFKLILKIFTVHDSLTFKILIFYKIGSLNLFQNMTKHICVHAYII